MVAYVVYILSKILNKNMKDQVPEEASRGKSCNISHLRIFLCAAYAYVPKELRNKLDERSDISLYLLDIARSLKHIDFITPSRINILPIEMLSSKRKNLGMEA